MPKNGIITVFYARNIIMSVKNERGNLKKLRCPKMEVILMSSWTAS